MIVRSGRRGGGPGGRMGGVIDIFLDRWWYPFFGGDCMTYLSLRWALGIRFFFIFVLYNLLSISCV